MHRDPSVTGDMVNQAPSHFFGQYVRAGIVADNNRKNAIFDLDVILAKHLGENVNDNAGLN